MRLDPTETVSRLLSGYEFLLEEVMITRAETVKLEHIVFIFYFPSLKLSHVFISVKKTIKILPRKIHFLLYLG